MDPWSFQSKDTSSCYSWNLSFMQTAGSGQKYFAKFHFCIFLLVQFSYTNVTDMSFTQQTIFHSLGGRKNVRNIFHFLCCKILALKKFFFSLVENGPAMGLTFFCKNTVLILGVLSVAEIPLTNRMHFTWLTYNPFAGIKLLILQNIQCLQFPLKWNTVLQQNNLHFHYLPLSPLGVNFVIS